MRNSGGRVLRWAGHPGTVLAVLLLAFNDHVGKPGWPGAVTGKLSDVAWMLVAPPVLALLPAFVFRWRGDRPAVFGIAATAVTFALAKSSASGAELASAAWSLLGVPSRTVADRTDLLALPALAAAWWLWRRSARPWPGWRGYAAVGVPLAVAAMVATSAADMSELWSSHGRPMLDSDGYTWSSDDGGVTWRPVRDTKPRHPDPLPDPASGACLPEAPQECYRLHDVRSPVERSLDGGTTWQEEFAPPWLDRSRAGSPATASPQGWERGRLLVVAVPGGGHTVIVSYGYWAGGVAVHTADGRWLAERPPKVTAGTPSSPDFDPSLGLGLPVAFVAGWIPVLAGLTVLRLRARGPADPPDLLLYLAARQAAPVAWILLASRVGTDSVPLVLAALGVPVLAFLLRRPADAWPRPDRRLALLALGALTGAAVFLRLFATWVAGYGTGWTGTCLWSLAYAGAAAAAAALLCAEPWRRLPRRSTPPPPPPPLPPWDWHSTPVRPTPPPPPADRPVRRLGPPS